MSGFRWSSGATGAIDIDGCSLEAACYGPAPEDAPTIILLHEGLGCVDLWRDFPARLATETGYGVFAYSRAGYGRSDGCILPRPIDYMSREAIDILPRVLDTVGFQHGILLGHSDGATIAAIYAGSLEDFRVRGLVLMAPHFFTEDMGLKSIAKARQDYDSGELRRKLAKYHSDVDNTFRGWNEAWLNPEFKDWNVSEVIDYLRIPVLAVQGRDDQYGTMAQIEEIENRIYSPLDVEILDNCGHAPHLEQADKTLACVSDFVRRLDRIENVSVKVR